MIVVDLETSGIDKVKCGIWQIGAVDLQTMEEFLQEAKIDDEDIITEESMKVIGKTEQQLRDPKKQTQKQLIENFFKWCENKKIKNFICQNPQFDYTFFEIKASKYGLKMPVHYRAFDLHSIAAIRYFQIKGEFLIKQDQSDIGLRNILKFCGMQDERISIHKGEIIQQGKPHNALEDAKLEAECFSRLLYGKNLFPEYAKFKIPEHLLK